MQRTHLFKKQTDANICHLDDGNPLYTFQCGSFTPKCLYGVASYYKSVSNTPGEFCNGGSFFANVLRFHAWITGVIQHN